ncbi:hypothetical protein [uncultured Rhodoblastus sp.]|uniref:hypothetical protein n=1 Tax=uncultured Rhodoblastus sp. TaxID=543037 RepID=UPI0025FAC0EF|nr:hypothetical protein [uncultured Rhodoblastus sp.]
MRRNRIAQVGGNELARKIGGRGAGNADYAPAAGGKRFGGARLCVNSRPPTIR